MAAERHEQRLIPQGTQRRMFIPGEADAAPPPTCLGYRWIRGRVQLERRTCGNLDWIQTDRGGKKNNHKSYNSYHTELSQRVASRVENNSTEANFFFFFCNAVRAGCQCGHGHILKIFTHRGLEQSQSPAEGPRHSSGCRRKTHRMLIC